MTFIKPAVFLIILSFVSASNDGGYKLTGNHTNDYYMDLETVFELSFGPWDILTNFSGRQLNEFVETNDEEQIKKILSWSNVISTTRVDDNVEPNYDAQKQNGTSYTILYDSKSGEMLSLTPNNEYSEQMLEMQQNDEVGALFGDNEDNVLYPFGSDSIRYVGDVWKIENNEKVDSEYLMFDEFDGNKQSTITYIFKKVKEKRGDTIAYITVENAFELSGIGRREDTMIEFTQTVLFTGNLKYNITKGITSSCKMSGAINGKGRDLDDDSEKNFYMSMDMKLKNKLK